jgi:AraC-like DNA-binding protein
MRHESICDRATRNSGRDNRAPVFPDTLGAPEAVRMSADDFAVLSFSTEEFPEDQRVAMLREHYGRTVLNAEIEAAEGAPFEARIASHILPDLHLLAGTLSAARITRTHEQAADGNDDLALVVSRTGTIAVSSRGRETLLHQGEAVLTSSEDAITFERFFTGDSFSLRIPRAVLQPLVVDIDDSIMRLIPQGSWALRLLTGYAGVLIDENALAALSQRQLAVGHLHDLLALTLGPTLDAAELARGRGVRVARLREAKVYIANNSGRQDISVTTVASHLGVTPRYLQRLFELDGATFSSFLLSQRLKRAHRMLCDQRLAARPVGVIAYDVGFGDLSYFNRCFRKAYGVTPTDIRNGHAR